MKRALVTGGSGYIGSHLVRALRRNGWYVTSFDLTAPFPTHSANSVVVGDLKNKDDMEYVGGHGFDVIFHLAAFIDVEESQKDRARYWENNVGGTYNLVEAFPNTPIIFSSTAAVYKSQNRPISETDETGPVSFYGLTKLAAENLVKTRNSVILRYFNVGGCADGLVDNHKNRTHLIPRIIEDEYVKVFGISYDTFDGTAIRDYVHVADVVDAHIKAADYLLRKEPSVTLNIGSGKGYSVINVLNEAGDVLDRDINWRAFPARIGDAPILIADISLAKKVLSYEPKMSLKDIIETHVCDSSTMI